jgi:hypothetical protein
MNWRRAAYGLGGGALGFCIVLAANFIFFLIGLSHMDILGGGGTSLTTKENFLVYIVLPAMICFGSMLTARSLGATWRRSIIAGVATFVVGALVFERSGNVLYVSEKLALTFSAITVVLAATLFRAQTDSTALVATIGLAVLLAVGVFPDNLFADIAVPILAWLLLPAVAGLFQ